MSDATNTAEPAPKSRKKAMLVAAAVGVLTLSGGGGAWWFLVHRSTDDAAAAAREAARREAARMFVTLDPFVVNLADRESERYAQVGVVLEVEGPDANKRIADRMPAVRNEILLLISSKLARDLMTREGKEALASEIAMAAARPLGWPPAPASPASPAATKARETQPGTAKAQETNPKAPDPVAKAQDKDAKAQDKDAKAQDKDAKAKAKTTARPEPPPPNPVARVHFASFIVQ
jgi:flagellar FliL protein